MIGQITSNSWANGKGFTIAELSVIILVIGILASLVTIGWGNWQKGIMQKAVQSDLQMVGNAMESAKNYGNGYPTSIPSTFVQSSDVTITYFSGGNATQYCIDGRASSNASIRYFINSTNKKPVAGTCAGGEEIPGIGETWVAKTAAAANTWTSVIYGNGIFASVASSGTSRVMTSSDGNTWTAQSSPIAAAGNWQDVTYGNGKFVAVGTSVGTYRAMTSTDGITWTAGMLPAVNWDSVTFGNGVFVAVAPSIVYTSSDGLTWSAASGIPSGNWIDVVYGNGKFAAVANSGTNTLMYSTNGTTWTTGSMTNGLAVEMYSVIYAAGKFVTIGKSSTNNVITSTDGISWTGTTVSSSGWRSIAYGSGMFVAVAESGANRVMTSLDAVTWTQRTAAENNTWLSIAYGDGKFVAVSPTGTNRVMVSP